MANINSNLVDILRKFNRKERFFLVGTVLGNTDFTLGKEFKKMIEKKLGVQIKGDIFSAMDYHLDWIDVSIKLYNQSVLIGNTFVNKNCQINRNQEDIDFIIAFESGSTVELILLEAKGETGWTNKQMDSKVKRFKELFGEDGERYKHIKPHFYLMSPKEPKRINKNWPKWMTTNGKPNWIKLTIPDNFLKVTRCNIEGIANQDGKYCIVKETKQVK